MSIGASSMGPRVYREKPGVVFSPVD
jgi:hypothetical protein